MMLQGAMFLPIAKKSYMVIHMVHYHRQKDPDIHLGGGTQIVAVEVK